MSGLQVKKIDSPLGQLGVVPPAGQTAALIVEPTNSQGVPVRHDPAVPATAERQAPPPGGRLELVGVRVPEQLADGLRRHAQGARERAGVRERELPLQDIVAAILWDLGDPDDPEAQARVDDVVRTWRQAKLQAAQAAL